MSDTKNQEIPIEISPNLLGEEVLAGIVENFILREGTDYGWNETSYAQKALRVRHQIERGEIKIVFDQASESVTLLTQGDFKNLISGIDPVSKMR